MPVAANPGIKNSGCLGVYDQLADVPRSGAIASL
jgi:hypothetical protein